MADDKDKKEDETQKADDTQKATAPDIPIQVHAQYVKDFSFENPNAPESLMPGQNAPDINVGVHVNYRELDVQENTYEVVLHVDARASRGSASLFIIELQYACAMSLSKEIPEEQIDPVLMIEGPRLMFPFARRVIADATQEGGYPPVVLTPVDFTALYRQRRNAEKEENEKKKA